MMKMITAIAMTLTAAACLGDETGAATMGQSTPDLSDRGMEAIISADLDTGEHKDDTRNNLCRRKICDTDDDCRTLCSGIPSCFVDPEDLPFPHAGLKMTCHELRAPL